MIDLTFGMRPSTIRWAAIFANVANGAVQVAVGTAFAALLAGVTIGLLISFQMWMTYTHKLTESDLVEARKRAAVAALLIFVWRLHLKPKLVHRRHEGPSP